VHVALAVWVVGGILSLFGALAYAELGAMDEGAGGLYSYVRDAFGQFPAFLFGWTLFFGIGGGTISALVVAATGYLGQFVTLSQGASRAVAVALIAGIGVITVRGIRGSASVQNWGSVVKLLAVVVMSVVLLAMDAARRCRLTTIGTFSLVSAAGTAMISVLWAYEGGNT
jgi:APA family basic amino acid/polyamine antiporter